MADQHHLDTTPPAWLSRLRATLVAELRERTPDHDPARCLPFGNGFAGLCRACRAQIVDDQERLARATGLLDSEMSVIVTLLGLRSLPAMALLDSIDSAPELRIVLDSEEVSHG